MNKRGQVTVFIIIGVILVLAASLVIYTRERVEVPEIEIIIPEEISPIYEYVSSCVQQSAREAITRMGSQGGFIDIPREVRRDRDSYLKIDPSGFVLMPYWYYRGRNRIPTLGFMEDALETYIDEQLPACINDFKAFEPAYDVVAEPPIITVTMAEEDVIVNLDYELLITQEATGKEIKLERILVKIPVRLKQIHRLGSKITRYNNDFQFLENFTIDIIAAMPSEMIPLSDLEFRCGERRWRVSELRRLLQQVLYYNVPRIRIKGTDFIPFDAPIDVYEDIAKLEKNDDGEIKDLPEDLPGDVYEYFHMYMPLDYEGPPGIKAKVLYQPAWGLAMGVSPSSGDIVSSKMARGSSGFMSFLCVNIYHFTYNILYPVEIRLKDEEAFNRQGFTFSFALPVTIKENEGVRGEFGPSEFESPPSDIGFCQELGADVFDIRVSGLDEDNFPSLELDEINISYECFRQRCDLGKTTFDGIRYRLMTNLPAGCGNPFIIAKKTGYLEGKRQLTSDQVTVPITKLKKMKYKVQKNIYSSLPPPVWEPPVEFNEEFNESAAIFIRLRETRFDQLLSYPVPPGFNDTIELPIEGGTFDVDISFTRLDDYIGGYIGDNVTISFEDIRDKDTIIFNVMQYRPTPRKEEEKLDMVSFMLTKEFQKILKPVFE